MKTEAANLSDIKRALSVLVEPGGVVELRKLLRGTGLRLGELAAAERGVIRQRRDVAHHGLHGCLGTGTVVCCAFETRNH